MRRERTNDPGRPSSPRPEPPRWAGPTQLLFGLPPPCLFRATVLPGIDEPPRHLNIDPGLSFGRLRSSVPTYRVL
nr:MAG TPA: hypothetical protein [Caudoviricetes sp.]